MKKYLALCVFLIASPLISKQPKIQQPKSYKEITSWKQIYSIPKMSDDCLSTIASALYYLLKQDSTDQDFLKQIISEFYEASRSQHRDCFNGLMKIYEKAMFSTAQIDTTETAAHNNAFKKALTPYYHELLTQLNAKDATIAFGNDAGKSLPALIQPELVEQQFVLDRPVIRMRRLSWKKKPVHAQINYRMQLVGRHL